MPFTRVRRLLLSSTLALAAVPLVATAQDQPQLRFDIPATSLDEALKAVGRQAGREIMYPETLVVGKRAPALSDRLTADEAIRRLLRDTDLEAEFRPDVVLLRGRSERSEEGAAPADGREVVVTATRLRGEPTTRVRAIGRDRALAEGFADLGALARTLPENFTGGQNPGVIGTQEGSENLNSSTALNLRGVGADATLTLVNGHRVAYDGANQGVDISAIPLLAIERLEVLPDGASAIHGSDAVAGVANVILRRDYHGLLTQARVAVPTRGGGFQQQYGVLSGRTWDAGGFMAALDFSQSDPITADQRAFTRTLDRSATILPGQKQYSGVLAGHQAIARGVRLGFDGHFNDRSTQDVAVPFLSPGDVRTNGALSSRTVRAYSLAPELQIDLPAGWQARLAGVHGQSTSRARVSSFSGGRELVRSRVLYQDQLDSAEAGAEGPLFDLPGGTARLAVGGGWRQVGFTGLINAVIAGVPRTTLNIARGYDVGFAYGEASLPLVGPANARPGLHLLHLNGAVRYEHYSGIGDVAVPRLSARLDPVQGFSLRVGWGRSFKVPTLFQIGQAPQGTLLPASYFRPPPPGGRPVLLLSGGGRELAPERAQTWTAGVVLAPLPSEDLRLEITYYHLNYQDRVLRPVPNDIVVFGSTAFADLVTQRSAAEIAALVSALPQGLANQTGAPFNPATVEAVIDNRLQNLARQRVEGIDIAVHAATPAGRGSRLLFDAGLSYLDSDQQASAGQPVVQRAGTIFDPPHWRGRASLGWERGGLGLTGAATYIGGVRDDRFQPATVVDSFLAVDLTARLHSPASRGPLAGATLFLSALNLLDQAPGRIRTTSAANPPFDTTNYPAIGRVLSLTVSKAW